MTPSAAPLESPCIRVCRLDAAGALCTGCGRTLPEIAGWSALASAERRRVMALLPDRLARLAEKR